MKNFSIRGAALAFVVLSLLAGVALVAVSVLVLDDARNVQKVWQRFDATRSEKARALNALKRELGYGGLIHHFKNYILRAEAKRIEIVEQKIGGAKAAIDRYRSLGTSDAEERALKDIDQALSNYRAALKVAHQMVRENKPAVVVDRVSAVYGRPTLEALELLSASVRNPGSQGGGRNKAVLLNELHQAMGYGGLIHEFKLYVLRGEDEHAERMRENVAAANEVLERYQAQALNPAEQRALAAIQRVVNAYNIALNKAFLLTKSKFPPREIDRRVSVADGPAQAGFTALTRELVVQNQTAAQSLASSIARIQELALEQLWAVIAIVILLIAIEFWLFFNRIILPLGHLNRAMLQLAGGNLDITIPDSGTKTEIGRMAGAMEVFRTNALERNRAEVALRDSEALFKTVIDNMPAVVFLKGVDGAFRLINRAYEELYEVKYEDVRGKTLYDIYPKEQADAFTRSDREAIEAARVLEREHVVVHDGVEAIYSNVMFPVFDHDGQITAFGGIEVDITERKRAEQEIKEQNEKITLLNRVAYAVNEAGSADEALGGCLREICINLGWPVGHAYLHNAGSEPPLLPSKVWHVDPGVDIAAFRELTEATGFSRGQGLPGRVLESNTPAWIVDVTEDPNFPRAAAAAAIGVKAGFAFPASIGDTVVAVMEFFANVSAEPDPRKLEMIGNIGQQLGGAIRRKIAEQDLQQAYSVIRESVDYAANIQRAALPIEELLRHAFDDHFIIWEPRDVVGGDMYWLVAVPQGHILGVADCTGHGVPGAFVTLLATSALRRAISEQPDADPARLIARMNRYIKEVLGQYTKDALSDDGLELGLCRIEPAQGRLAYAGARFSLWQVQDGKASEFKGDKRGIGYTDVPLDLELKNHEIAYSPESRFYLYSDGFLDQIGGPKRRALGKRRLMGHIIEHQDKDMGEQRELILEMFRSYQGGERRRDDLIMIGFRL